MLEYFKCENEQTPLKRAVWRWLCWSVLGASLLMGSSLQWKLRGV